MAEKEFQKIKKERSQKKDDIDQFINVSNAEEFTKPERVSKRLSRMGICSRRMAEQLIEKGMVRVDGKTIDHNLQVTNENLL